MRTWVALICVLLAACKAPEKPPIGRAAVSRRQNGRRPPKRYVLSPIGGYIATAETPSPQKPERDIVITRPGEKREILRYPFQRQVDLVWAPDESGVAVVDMVLANETRVVIFELPGGRPLYELRREHICEINPQLPCGGSYTHVFFSDVIWLAPDRIQVTVDMINPLEPNLPRQLRDTLVVAFPREIIGEPSPSARR
jgi:hypothetical protein